MLYRNFNKLVLIIFSILFLIFFSLTSGIYAQENWTALPPYNTLWPLWSQVLSPYDAITGIRTPIVTSLESSVKLPVEPAITWDPSLAYPWLLYNTPVGMAYFDPLYGINFWPPEGFLDATGAPLPIALPNFYSILAPTSTIWLQQNVLFANSYFLQVYPSLLATADPAALLAAATIPLPPAVVGALTLGLPVPGLGITVFPPPDILDFLTPAALLGW
ncbi:MAG: hypothetical protein ACMUJM_13000 [bacterium]